MMKDYKDFPRRRARHVKIGIIAGSVLLVLALCAVVTISVLFARQAALERAKSGAANLAAAFAEELTHTLTDASGTMELLANRMRANGANFDLQAWASDIPLMTGGAIQGAIVAPDGKLVATTRDANAPLTDLSDRDYFRVHLDGTVKGLYVSEPVIGRQSNQTTIPLSKRVDGNDGRFLGVLVLSLPPRTLTTLHKLVDIGERGIIGLERTDGLILARFSRNSPDGAVPPGLRLPGGPWPNVGSDDARGYSVMTSIVDHVTRLYSYRRVPGYPLVVTVGLDLAEAVAPAMAEAQLLVSLAAACALLLAGLAAWLIREIGKRAEREIEVANGRALLQDAVESVSEGFVIFDRDDKLLLLNESYRSLFGTNRSVKTTFEELVRGGLAEGRYLDAIGHEEEWLADRLHRHRDGRDSIELRLSDGRWVIATDRRMRNGGIVGLRIDITALKRAQAALRESEQRLERSRLHLTLAQELSRVGSLLRDLRTGTAEWSDELHRILGIEPSPTPPDFETFLQHVHPDDRAAVAADRDAVLHGDTQKVSEYRMVRPDGTVRVVQRGLKLLVGEDGKPSHYLIIFRDITEAREAEMQRRELERELHHSQKLEALGTLAGGIAHDLNNTLVPIVTISKLGLRRAKRGTPDHEDLELIYRSGLRARNLVRQILAFSRKEVGDRRLFRVDEVVSEAVSLVRPTIPSMIRIEVDAGPVPPIMGDPTQIHQVLVNLITNAVHAIGMQHGAISISLRSVPGTKSAEPSSIRLVVADTGCGMDEATQRRIFDPFFTTKPIGEGTGLGLSVVHRIVSNHGGAIEVQSKPGDGTSFIINLPQLADATETTAITERSVA